MVAFCCVCKLPGGQENDISIHRLPKDEKTRANWFAFIGRKISVNNGICSKHFIESDFIYKKYGHDFKKCLKPGTCPSVLQNPQNTKESAAIVFQNKNICTSPRAESSNINPEPSAAIVFQNKNICTSPRAESSNINPEPSVTFENEIEEEDTYIESTINTKSSIDMQLKRKTDDSSGNTKRICTARYAGDLCREHFTSDEAWRIFTKYMIESNKKTKTLYQKVVRTNQKLQTLQEIIDHLKEIGNLSSDTTDMIRTSMSPVLHELNLLLY